MEQQVITIAMLMEMFDIKYDLACKKMREIKSVSDRLGIKGRVHKLDYEKWLSIKEGR